MGSTVFDDAPSSNRLRNSRPLRSVAFSPGFNIALDVGDGGFVDRLRAPDALDLVGGLDDLGRADDSAGVDELPVVQGRTERHREVVDRQATRR